MATHNVVPEPFDTGILMDGGAEAASIHTYNGYKEDVYIAAFEPDPTFPNQPPFEDYVVVRPEALTAAYVDNVESIVPSLLDTLVKDGHNVVYLPHGSGDETYAILYPDDKVFVPMMRYTVFN